MRAVDASRVVIELAVTLAALVGVGWLLGWALTTQVTGWELPLLHYFIDERRTGLTSFVQALTNVGSGVVLVPIGLLVVVFLVRQGRLREAVFVAVVAAGAVGLFPLLKELVDRPRPPVTALVTTETFSFPSSHAGDSLAIYGASVYTLARQSRLLRKVAAWALAAGLVLFVGWSRLYLGVHYVSDVVGGYLLAGTWLAAAGLIFARTQTPATSRGT